MKRSQCSPTLFLKPVDGLEVVQILYAYKTLSSFVHDNQAWVMLDPDGIAEPEAEPFLLVTVSPTDKYGEVPLYYWRYRLWRKIAGDDLVLDALRGLTADQAQRFRDKLQFIQGDQHA